jgi:hypothetical protein
MTYGELAELPVGTIVIDETDDELGVVTAGRFFKVIQWDGGCRSTLCTDGKQASMKTPFRANRQGMKV